MKSPKDLFCWWVGIGLLTWTVGCNLHAFAIVPPNHQLVTQQALGSCCFEYTLPNDANAKFSFEAVNSVVEGNFNIDILSLTDDKFAEDYHFDDERFSLGQYLLLNTRDLIVTQMRDEAFGKSDPQSLLRQQKLTKTSREMLGNALHTLQDYYAHSNWVERGMEKGNLSINPFLGAGGEILHGPSVQTCEENDPGESPVTSGYYLASGVLDCFNICDAPVTECAHGNIVCPLLDCGINKDISTRNHYAEAFDLATQHTKLFVQKIFDEALIGDSALRNRVSIAICELMGVPNPLSTCVTSHTVTVQKLNNANGQLTLEGLVESSGNTITPAINCGLLCEGTAIVGSTVVLTAKNSGNWRFVRWAEGGTCAGSTTPDCSFTVTGDLLARPEFTLVELVVPISPKASFLRSDPGDPTLQPIVIDLNELGIVPGQVIELSSSGFYYIGTNLTVEDRRLNMMFSSSNELLSHNELHRVPGALSAAVIGLDTGTTCTSPTPLPTDIPEDFSVASPNFYGGSNPVVVTVPTGALYLFAGIFDCAYWDNSDPDGDLEIAVRYPSN